MNEITALTKLMSINSHSLNRAGVNQKLDLIQEWTADLPFDWQRVPSKKFGDLMIGSCCNNAPDKPQVGLVLHADTVHMPERDYPIRGEGTKLHGPGAQDMQASLYVVVEVLRELHSGGKLQNVQVLINSCEEFGTPEFRDQFQQFARDVNYVMTYEASGPGRNTPGSKEFNREVTLVTARKGIFGRKFITKGPGGHSGVLTEKHQRHNAISQAVQMMAAIDALADYEKGTTVNLQYVSGGQQNTIIARDCEFSFDIRFATLDEYKRTKEATEKILNTKYVDGVDVIDAGYVYDLPSLQPNKNSDEFAEKVKSIGSRLGINVNTEKRGGGSDASLLYAYNPGLFVLDGFGPKGDGEHTDNEFVYLDTIPTATLLCVGVIRELVC
ncbi:M20/M25/M40 family metallo-hydrolase [Candidatus Dojkabacteria bacterium]|uniref:M20/M25/M40 family metallo-hydrolase n=1 Tax=Candidatus Dojkabacteria bacterium TaxID=2099670 RepID=A0A955KYU8_9BACT|nr:M20/M25/M40 family metallo-hydrolase [Candidatus Dojkabacteria bacterium]